MGFIFGLILGVLATLGVAYVHDATVSAPEAKIVNWPALDSSMKGAKDDMSRGVDKLKQIGS